MDDFIIELTDEKTLKQDYIVFSERDLFEIKREAGRYPASPLIVKKISEKACEKGFAIDNDESELFSIAKEIIIEEGGTASVTCRFGNLGQPVRIETAAQEKTAIYLVKYENPLAEMDKITSTITSQGKMPVIWSKTKGLMLKDSSGPIPLSDTMDSSDLNNPKEMINFIIRKPQKKIAYILEDFHHYIGGPDTVNPAAGEIRALLKDLSRCLEEREERVFLFVPASYELPDELRPFLDHSLVKDKSYLGHLDKYSRLLSDAEFLSHSKPVIGAEAYIERLIQILSQMEANNPLLVGHPGVGKTAIVEGLARALFEGQVTAKLRGRKLYSLSLTSLIAGTKYRGDLEARLDNLMKDVLLNKDRLIIFIDEIHTLLDAGSAEGAIGARDILKPVLSKGEFPCIGATTYDGAQYFSRDATLSRRFKKVVMKEPSKREAITILRGVSNSFGRHHGVIIDDEALIATVNYSSKYMTDGYLPGKAISLLDGAAAYCSVHGVKRVKKRDILIELERIQDG